jgi:hypothetical protein
MVEVHQICTASLPGCVQYGGGKELANLPHLTPGLVRLAVVVWGVLYVYLSVCLRVGMRI